MGISGGDPYGFGQVQNFANANSLAQYNQYQVPPWPLHPPPTVSVRAAETKIRTQIDRLLEALPLSICSRIARVDFYPKHDDTPMRFVVAFDTGKEVTFEDVDNFPSDEHVAHVALACP